MVIYHLFALLASLFFSCYRRFFSPTAKNDPIFFFSGSDPAQSICYAILAFGVEAPIMERVYSVVYSKKEHSPTKSRNECDFVRMCLSENVCRSIDGMFFVGKTG
jgi:hypothetical protein